MEIIINHHSTKVEINKAQPGGYIDTHSDNVRLHIKDCCGSVINDLKEAGFSLSMDNGLLLVLNYSIGK